MAQEIPRPPSRPVRVVLTAVGLISVGLGTLGVFLPLLPTTPFILLAAACFARSSPRLHAWLYRHKWFGPPLRSWHDHRAIPRKTKVVAIAALWLAFTPTIVLFVSSNWLRAVLAALLVTATIVVLLVPTLRREDRREQTVGSGNAS